MSTIFIIDIDGTIADGGRRFAKAGPEPTRDNKEVYDAWVAAIQTPESLAADKPVPGMRDLCELLSRSYFTPWVVYLTSREEKWRSVTEEWLEVHDFPEVDLIMRGNEDYSEGDVFKETAINTLLDKHKYTQVVVIDDDGAGTIEAMCKRRGWTFLKARSGGQL